MQLDASAEAFLSEPLAPGSAREFEAVVLEEALPERGRRILLEVVDPAAEATLLARPSPPDKIANGSVPAQAGAAAALAGAEGGAVDPDPSASGTKESGGRVSDLLDLAD
jgi:predicted component of type VI protein secretion system